MNQVLHPADAPRSLTQPVRGFSMVELVIVMAIIGIIAAIAIPNYQRYLVRGNRTAAKVFISDLAQRQESFFADRKHYSTTFGALGFVDAASGAALGTDAFIDAKGALSSAQVTATSVTNDVSIYKVSLVTNPTGGATAVRQCAGLDTAPTTAAFTTAWAAVAVPQLIQSTRDSAVGCTNCCANLCNNSTGRQGASGAAGWQACWRG